MPTQPYPDDNSPYAIRSYSKSKFEVLKEGKVVATMKNLKMAKMYIEQHLSKEMPEQQMGEQEQMGAMPQQNMGMGAMPNSPGMKPPSKYQ